jgi:hypothetical protein
MDELIVQPVGGFAGAGGPGPMKTEGRIAVSALSPQDRTTVEGWFAHPSPAGGNFYYRITRQRAVGQQTVDVPADKVPAALVASVKTTLD